ARGWDRCHRRQGRDEAHASPDEGSAAVTYALSCNSTTLEQCPCRPGGPRSSDRSAIGERGASSASFKVSRADVVLTLTPEPRAACARAEPRMGGLRRTRDGISKSLRSAVTRWLRDVGRSDRSARRSGRDGGPAG